ELRKQHVEGEKKKFKDFPPKVREHIAKSIHYRRLAAAQLRDANAVSTLFEQIAPRYLQRPGGYLRVLRTGEYQLGDNPPQAILGFVEGAAEAQPAASGEAP